MWIVIESQFLSDRKFTDWRFFFQMKHFNIKKILMMLAVVVVVENGAIVASNMGGNSGSYTEDGGAAPCSDLPVIDESYN